MSRQNHLFQSTVNKLLEIIERQYEPGDVMPNDSEIARQLDVSRSTVRKALEYLQAENILDKQGSKKVIRALPDKGQFFNLEENSGPKEEMVEHHFMRLIKSGEIKPGDRFSELELARQSDCNTVTVREFLIRFSRFGLIEKKPRSQWSMKSFDEAFVDDLYELRHLFEMNTLSNFMVLPTDSEHWSELQIILDDHKKLKLELPERFKDFSDLDKRFHTLLQKARDRKSVV